jgi:dihydroflavonol-4-reductase
MLTVVTGASGLLGANLAAELLHQGHRVRATRRGRTRVDHLADLAIEWVDADLSDEGALARAFDGAERVYHCAALVSIQRRATPELVAANVDGTRHVLAAVRRAGVRRLIHCSTVGAVGLSEDGRPSTEAARWNFAERAMDDGYVTTKRRAEDLVQEAASAGLDAVIVNPTYMLGPRDARPSSGKLIVDVVRGKAPGWTPGCNNFVDVRDVARGMVLAGDRGAAGERYILGNENMSYRDIMATIARVAGVAAPSRRVPRWLAALLGLAGDAQERLLNREPLINSVVVRYGFCPDFIFSSDKARQALGYSPGPIEPAIADAIAWFRAHGMLP